MSKVITVQARYTKFFLTTTVALSFAFAGPAVANGVAPEITSPSDGEKFFANDLIELIAHDKAAANNYVYWAVRDNTCDVVAAANVAGNVSGFEPPNNTPYAWENGEFYSLIDAAEFAAGNYCFIFNTEGGPLNQGSGVGVRLTRWFEITNVLKVDVDIKPGSDPNCFNVNGHGVIPVAVMGSESFDVSQIDPATLAFGDLVVRVRGKKGPLCGFEDTNLDGFTDYVCHFEDDSDAWAPGDGEAALTGNLYDGTPIFGMDSICVVPE